MIQIKNQFNAKVDQLQSEIGKFVTKINHNQADLLE